MQLWLATIIGLDENENEKHVYIIQKWWHSIIIENLSVFVIGNVLHKRLNNIWHLVQLELWLYIIVADVHVLVIGYYMQYDMLT
jgi:hypothetical protein